MRPPGKTRAKLPSHSAWTWPKGAALSPAFQLRPECSALSFCSKSQGDHDSLQSVSLPPHSAGLGSCCSGTCPSPRTARPQELRPPHGAQPSPQRTRPALSAGSASQNTVRTSRQCRPPRLAEVSSVAGRGRLLADPSLPNRALHCLPPVRWKFSEHSLGAAEKAQLGEVH